MMKGIVSVKIDFVFFVNKYFIQQNKNIIYFNMAARRIGKKNQKIGPGNLSGEWSNLCSATLKLRTKFLIVVDNVELICYSEF